jgi:formylglycine-generating enzyme required for sulfatase activity
VPSLGLSLAALAMGFFAHGCALFCPCAAKVPAPEAPGSFVQDISETTVSFEMIGVAPGIVTVDTEDGPRPVEVGPFWIGRTELTWDVYDVFCLRLDRTRSEFPAEADAVTRPSKPYLPPDRGFGHDGYAAISMTHHAAETFCQWLSLKTSRTYRLPTEAEWQHACEVGAIDPRAVDEHAWYKANADYKTQPVATKRPDALGIHDMYGNVWEWCNRPDGEPITTGGSFRDEIENIGLNARAAQDDSWNASDPQFPKSRWWLADASWVGFRVICVLEPEPQPSLESQTEQQRSSP